VSIWRALDANNDINGSLKMLAYRRQWPLRGCLQDHGLDAAQGIVG
jgi:hypothetical protein